MFGREIGMVRARVVAAQDEQGELGSLVVAVAAAASPVRRNCARREYLHNMWSISVSDIVTCAAASASRQLLSALRAFRRGNFSVRMPHNLTGIAGEIAEAFNDVVELERRTRTKSRASPRSSARKARSAARVSSPAQRAAGRYASTRSMRW